MEAKGLVVVTAVRKEDGGTVTDQYPESGVTLTSEKGSPHFKPVAGGAEITTRNRETGEDEVKFVKSGEELIFDGKYFKHIVKIK